MAGLDPLNVDTSLPDSGMPGIDAPTFGAGGMPTLDVPTLPGLAVPTSAALPAGNGDTRSKVVALARQYLGTPYVWGAASPGAFDCSGLVQYVTKQFGLNLPRVSYQQANAGQRVSLDQLRPGDLVAWDNSPRNNGADHIAIYIGNGQIIEAPRPGKNVQISKLYDTKEAIGVALRYPGE